MFKKLKLKDQLYVLIGLTLAMFLLFCFIVYMGFGIVTYRRANHTSEQMIEQIVQNVNTMAENIENSAGGLAINSYVQELLVSEDPVRNMYLRDYVDELIHSAKASNNYIYGISWISDEGRILSDPVRSLYGIVNELKETYDITNDAFRESVFSSVVYKKEWPTSYAGYIFPIYALNAGPHTKIGCGIFVLDMKNLEKLVKMNNLTENSLFAILDQNDDVMVSNSDLKGGMHFDNIFWNEKENDRIKTTLTSYKGMKSLSQCREISETGWKVVSIILVKELYSDMYFFVGISLIVVFLFVVLLMYFQSITIKSITKPINEIVSFLNQSDTYSFQKRMNLPVVNEIEVISSSIDEMLDKVEIMTQKIVENQTLLYEAKLLEQDAKLLALQSQINPHFLYNTLSCISNISMVYEVPDIADITFVMSNIYRYSIKGDKFVTIQEEISCIKEFMKITDIRFDGRFDVKYQIEEEVLHLYSLKMILQPLVENAVYHGLERKKGKGLLQIEGEIDKEEQTVVLKVIDNGKGMKEEDLQSLRESIAYYEDLGLYSSQKEGIALSNINKRIIIQYGQAYGLQIESKECVGTTVILRLPVVKDGYAELSDAMKNK